MKRNRTNSPNQARNPSSTRGAANHSRRALVLHRTTLRTLSAANLRAVAGGGMKISRCCAD